MFTFLGRLFAFIFVAMGMLKTGMGMFVAINFDGNTAAISRYLGSVENTGEAIDQGVFMLVSGIALGVVVEISRSLKRIADETASHHEDEV